MLAEAVATPLVENRRINYVLIDHENVQPTDLKVLDREDVRLWVFVGAGQTKLSSELAIQMQAMRERADYVRISGNGSNALDFHIAFYIGQLAREDPRGFFHIISRDTGFDPLIKHLKAKKIFSCRSAAIAEMPLFKPVVAKVAAAPVANTVTVVEKAPERTPAPTKPEKMVASVAVRPAKPLQPEVAMNAAKQLAKARLVLAKMKTNKPATLAALKKHLASHFQNQIKGEELEAVIAGLKKAGAVKLEDTKVIYG